jgi:photosystem II stability/assembly factor-like uncharacterized protein
MNGWVERLLELGNLSGGYGSRNSYLSDWSTIPNIPNVVWPASWYANAFDPYATVFGISWLEGLWTNHQRIRQYAGEINNSWGGVTLNIDIDVADGMVAMPPAKPLANPVVTKSPSIEDAGWLSAEQGWLVSGNKLYSTNDRGKNWEDISPGSIQLAHFLNGNQVWALSTPNLDWVSLYHSSNRGATWESFELTLPSGSWWPLQLQFTSPSNGWIVVQKETSQAFSSAVLMKTGDGGLTWQTYDLPATAKINFISQREAWLRDTLTGELYQTTDGGLSWLIAQSSKSLLSLPKLPEGSTLSGWQMNGVSWSVTSPGACEGDKSTPNFACQVTTTLWQTVDGGQNWVSVPLPSLELVKP